MKKRFQKVPKYQDNKHLFQYIYKLILWSKLFVYRQTTYELF